MTLLSCFKAYDVRGKLGDNLDADIVYRIGRAFGAVMAPKQVVTGRDCRASSTELQQALHRGLLDQGVDVIDLGLCGTEEVYFGTDHFGVGGGLMVTASHNPIDYNGIKMVQTGSRPISADQGMTAIHDMAAANEFPTPEKPGTLTAGDCRAEYVDRVLSFVNVDNLKPAKILVNAGNGSAGPTFDAIADALAARGAPIEFIRHHHAADGNFPNGIPNPLLLENQPKTADPVRQHGADLGVAWDGDFDRCFFFDENGGFVDGEYVVSLLAAVFLAKEPGSKIVHDPRVIWNTQQVVNDAGGTAVASRTGHALIKAKMREVDALYGGEMSAHHYFRNFMYCDSGMIPMVLVMDYMATTGKPLSELVADMKAAFPSSGEINFRLENPQAAVDAVEAKYLPQAGEVDRLDGLSLAFDGWRLNLRQSNTEPVIRLNVETAGDPALLKQKTDEITALITGA